MNSRRVKTLRISWDLFAELFTPGLHPACAYEVTDDGIPADAKLVNVRLGWPYDQLEILLESATFPELAEGDAIPMLTPICRTRSNGAAS